jgi:hypothetical protein
VVTEIVPGAVGVAVSRPRVSSAMTTPVVLLADVDASAGVAKPTSRVLVSAAMTMRFMILSLQIP